MADTENFEKMDDSLQGGCVGKNRGVLFDVLPHTQNTFSAYSGVGSSVEHTEGVGPHDHKKTSMLRDQQMNVAPWGGPLSPPRVPDKWLARQLLASPVSPLDLPGSPSTPVMKKPKGAHSTATLEEDLGVATGLEMVLNIC